MVMFEREYTFFVRIKSMFNIVNVAMSVERHFISIKIQVI